MSASESGASLAPAAMGVFHGLASLNGLQTPLEDVPSVPASVGGVATSGGAKASSSWPAGPASCGKPSLPGWRLLPSPAVRFIVRAFVLGSEVGESGVFPTAASPIALSVQPTASTRSAELTRRRERKA